MMTLTKAEQAERDMERCICGPTEQIGRMTTPADDGEASVWICGLNAHREAAARWVHALTGKDPHFIRRNEDA